MIGAIELSRGNTFLYPNVNNFSLDTQGAFNFLVIMSRQVVLELNDECLFAQKLYALSFSIILTPLSCSLSLSISLYFSLSLDLG